MTVTPLDIRTIAFNGIGAIPDFPEFIGAVAVAQAGNYSNFELPSIGLAGIVSVPLECGDYREYIILASISVYTDLASLSE